MCRPLTPDVEIQNIINSIGNACLSIYKYISEISFVDKETSKTTLNPSNEHSLYIDILAQNKIIEALSNIKYIYAIISEEEKNPIILNNEGKYIVSIDPLDGSSNITSNGPTGTIFAIFEFDTIPHPIYSKKEPSMDGFITKASSTQNNEKQDDSLIFKSFTKDIITLLQNASIVSAGYALYSTTLMLTYAIKETVNMLAYSFQKKKYKLLYSTYKIPQSIFQYYSINEGYNNIFDYKTILFLDKLKNLELKSRYSGALVAEIHRILISGGIFMYPATQKDKNGKIRLFFEAYPMAYIVHAAGGTATDGNKKILDIIPQTLHQKTPIYIGSKPLMKLADSARAN